MSGNPAGRPPLPEDVQAAKLLSHLEFEAIANDLLTKTKDEVSAIIKDPSTKGTVLIVAKVIRGAMWSSDPKRLEWLLTRLIGKPKPQGEGDAKPVRSFIDLVMDAEKAKGSRGKH